MTAVEAFLKGTGDVVSGAVTGSGELLTLKDRAIVVSVTSAGGGAAHIENATATALQAVSEAPDGPAQITLAAGLTTTVPFGDGGELHLQILPHGAAFPEVVTITLSADASVDANALPPDGPAVIVGQAFTGGV